MPDLKFEAPQQFVASTTITASHVDSITTQSTFMMADEKSTEELKRQHQALKTASVTLNFRKFKVALNPMYRIFLNFAKSCMSSCLSKFYNKKKFHRAVFEI